MKYCPVSKKCGGCAYIDVPYEEQLKMKREEMRITIVIKSMQVLLEIKRQIESMQACMKKIVIVKFRVRCA